MAITTVPEWMENLEEEDLVFIKKFVLYSGSLKKLAELRGHLSDRTPQAGQIDRQDPGAGTGGNRALCQTDQKTGAGGPH